MPKLSAGLLLYRRNGDDVQVLIAHPGGPIWSRRDTGAWSLPKGAPLDGEELFDSARREFQEETGHAPPPARRSTSATCGCGRARPSMAGRSRATWIRELAACSRRSSGPRVRPCLQVPEIDRVPGAGPAEARRRLNPAQAAFVDRLLQALAREG